ncbi:MAG: MFS transporter [Proteobacteria bacterium]|nr:MFS transporter [Pseudomonadota bacterium]
MSEPRTPTPAEVRGVVGGAMLAMFLFALDQTIVTPALPPIARELGDFALISWIVTAYLLTSTCVTPILGKLCDLHGRRWILAGCLVVFMASSVLCALAPDMLTLIIARGLQGVGGGGLVPVCQAVIADVVSPRERGRFAAYFSIVWATSAVLGPVVGGLLTEYFGWPWIFWINLPLGAVALVIVDRALRRLPVVRRQAPIDYLSALLLTGAAVALLVVLSLGGKRLAWTAPETVALVAAALVLGALFVRQQTRSVEPILPPRFLADGVIRPVLAASFLIYGSYLAVTVLATIYYQVALGVSVGTAGLLMIPLMLSSTLTANMAGHYSQRTGLYKRPVLVSLPIAIVATALLALLADRLAPWEAAALMTCVGLGVGPTFPCSTVSVQNAVDRHDLGTVSGALAFTRSLGAAILIAGASALVLGLAVDALPGADATLSLEDLARHELSAPARAAVAHAFGVTFGALTAGFVVSLAIFARVENRRLQDTPGISRAPAPDRTP